MVVTSLIANYNYGQYIADAIDGCLNQTHPNKICIVDDCSTDDSVKIATEKLNLSFLVPQENNICKLWTDQNNKVIQLKQNSGPSFARNVGIDYSIEHTDYFMIADADDIMYSHKIQTMLDYIKDLSQVGVVYADYDIYNTQTKTLIRELKEPFVFNRLQQECIVHSNSLVSSEALLATREETGYYDVNMRTCEDYDLWLRIAEKFNIIHIPESLTKVLVQPNNSTFTVQQEIWQQNWNRIREKFARRNNIVEQ